MTKIAQLWDLIETSSFRKDIKGIMAIKDNDADYNDKKDNNTNDTYNKDDKVDKKDRSKIENFIIKLTQYLRSRTW